MMQIAFTVTKSVQRAKSALKSSTITALKKAGAYYRSSIQRSMRWTTLGKRYKPSPPGEPPKAIRKRGQLRKFIVYETDTKNFNVQIAPKRLGRGFTPKLLEEGGTRKAGRPKPGVLGTIDKRNGREIVVRLKTQRQAKRAAGFRKPVTIEARPYLSSTVKRVAPQVKKLFFSSFDSKFKSLLK